MASRLTNSGQGVAEGFLDVLAERRKAADEEGQAVLQNFLRGSQLEKASDLRMKEHQAVAADTEARTRATGGELGALMDRFNNPQVPMRPMSLDELLAGAVRLPLNASQTALVQDKLTALKPQTPHFAPEYSRGYVQGTQYIPIDRPAAGSVTQPPGTRPVVTVDRHGQPSTRYEYEDRASSAPFQKNDVERQVALEHETAGQPWFGKLPPGSLARQQRYNDIAKQYQVPPGGATFGVGTGTTPGAAPAATVPGAAPGGTPGAALPTGVPLAQRAFQPSPQDRDVIGDLDASDTMLTQILTSLKSGTMDNVLGGIFKNPRGTWNRLTEEYVGYGMSDEQRKLMGLIGIQLQSVKTALIGATRTRPELADIAAAIPDEKSFLRGDTTQQAAAKLEALLLDFRNKRKTRGDVMSGSGVLVPPPPSPPILDKDVADKAKPVTKGKGPSAPEQGPPSIRWGRDAQGNPVRLQ